MTDKLAKAHGVATVMPAQILPSGKTAVVQFILNEDPYSSQALNDINGPILSAAHSLNSNSTHVYVGGATAAIADIQRVTDRDLRVVFPIAAVFIFIILGLLVRSLVAPFVLLACVALGYVATLGATTLIFENIGGQPGLISFIPLFLYLFVVAIGTDYNILTITRLREEIREGNTPRKAADLTVEHSSATVVSAGLILAGTFASLILGGLSFLSQMGASIAIGVMLAAFIIAPFLIPSLAARVGYAIWWPGHKPNSKH
jgi:RND superfamily putative drug exporter